MCELYNTGRLNQLVIVILRVAAEYYLYTAAVVPYVVVAVSACANNQYYTIVDVYFSLPPQIVKSIVFYNCERQKSLSILY